ncbi:kinase-like domain-containing protein [Lasiosphaeria ovina]|uniref:Kinase-like domain-containing protein n=1 Tax=Lasiosphaeria ovina TaxID=92902 RepID=A0AAE0N805_9PEZI|nr:kinase-like domain-containing protein [Lasiosphaeria ovina]
MDLFHSSGHFSETSVPASSSDREAADEADCHQNLIRFLQVAQVLGVPLLPLAWDPALESVGREGSTAHINQSTLNAEFTFAFKRFKPHTTRNDVSEGEFRQMQYDAAIAEMTVLSHRTIRRHPNIVTFVGAGFEMSPVSDEVWPVLVSTKADLGDLYTFLSTRTPLHVESLVAICKEIASGIQVMHHCGVIHGDLKPTNILVEDVKDTDNIQVKVTDFGFSCFQAAQNSDLKVARTQPWEAPEWHSRHFSIADAKAMDIYSFGLLCLWILFRHEKLVVLGVPLVTLDEAFLSKDAAVTAKVQSLKKRADNSMLSCALGLVSNAIGIDDEYGSRLRRLFNLTLCSDPEQRAQTLDDLIPILAVSGQEDEAGMR